MSFEITNRESFNNEKSKLITGSNLENIVAILVLEAKSNVITGNRPFQINIDKLKNFFPILYRNQYNDKYRYKLKSKFNGLSGDIVLRFNSQNSYEYVQITFTDALQDFKREELSSGDFFAIIKFKNTNEFEICKTSSDEEKLYLNLDLISDDNTSYELEIESEDVGNSQFNESITIQKIFFGSPGTGKSFAADKITGANIEGQKNFVEKTTFHPEYDYNSFVGGYKPVMVKKGEENKIEYKFVPQIFTNIYVKAWNDLDNHYFLQVEEINRGNCAEIFGDLFQLLDRDENGKSKYETTATEDLKIYLEENLKENGLDGIKGGKLRLPSNLSIVATMNTSDQSLFPMDSAFKRRWDWEYVPIEYDSEKSDSDFIITLTSGSKYKWLDFLKEVNQRILKATHSQDKQIGNWFINAKNTGNIIDEKTFINKVIFYLWNDVFKDEDLTIFKDENNEIIKDSKDITYEHFFTNNIDSKLVEHIFTNNLNLKKIEDEVSSEPEEA